MSEGRTEPSPVRVVLLEKDGRYFFYEPGLAVIGSGENVAEAYSKFIGARHGYVTEAEQAGLAPGASFPGVPQPRGFGAELGLFTVKACVVFIFIVGALAVAMRPLTTISMYDVADKIWVIAKDLRELSSERKETLRQNIGEISHEIAPYVEAWRSPGEIPAPAATAKPGK